MSNRIPLPPPALTQHPSGNVYFSPQQMQEHADKAWREGINAAADIAWSEIMAECKEQRLSPAIRPGAGWFKVVEAIRNIKAQE